MPGNRRLTSLKDSLASAVMSAKRHKFDGPLNELDYARAIDPLSRYGPAMASFFKGIAITCGLIAVGTVGSAVAYGYYKPRRTVKVR